MPVDQCSERPVQPRPLDAPLRERRNRKLALDNRRPGASLSLLDLSRHTVSSGTARRSARRCASISELREGVSAGFTPQAHLVRDDVMTMERPHRDARPEAPRPPSTSGRPIVGPLPDGKLAAAASEAQSQRERVALSLILCPAREEQAA